MGNSTSSWYISSENKQHAGPFTAEQLIQGWQAGKIGENTSCWREGMTKWLPFSQVEPFASAIKSANKVRPGGKIVRWLTFGVIGGLFLGLFGIALYAFWNEWSTMQKIEAAVAAEDYEDAIRMARKFINKSYLYHNEISYVSALAAVKQFALMDNDEDADTDSLKKYKIQLRDLFKKNEKWSERAKTDFAGIIDAIPKKTNDRVARSMALAAFCQELKIADDKQTAQDILGILKYALNSQQGFPDINITAIKEVMRLDSTQAHALIKIILPEKGDAYYEFQQKSQFLHNLVAKQPALAKPLAEYLMEQSVGLEKSNKNAEAEEFLKAAQRYYPELQKKCVQQRLEWLKTDLTKKDYTSVMNSIGRLNGGYSADISEQLASICLDVAKQVEKKNVNMAQHALDRAFQLQPSLAESEPDILLWIKLHPEPSLDKLKQCEHYLKAFPSSEYSGRIQIEIIDDAVILSNLRHLNSAFEAAVSLMKEGSFANELEARILKLAKCLANENQLDKAVEIADLFCMTFPNSTRKQEMEGLKIAWKTRPHGPKPPGKETRPEVLNDKLLRRKRTISVSTAVNDAVANKDILIIEVADNCTADEFDAEQTRLLRDWVANGGVLWVNSNVLGIFGIRYSLLEHYNFHADCEAAGGTHPILEGVKNVHLECMRNQSCSLNCRGVIPLLALNEEQNDYPAGTTVWSLVPYGKGWISDPKQVDFKQGEGALFWGRFCQFCLHELPWPPPVKVPGGEELLQNTLSGTWEASAGAKFRINDDGKTAVVELIASDVLKEFSGTLTRNEDNPDAKSLSGDFDVCFRVASDKRSTFHITATMDGPDRLRLKCSSWPILNYAGKKTGSSVLKETWTRSNLEEINDGGPGIIKPQRPKKK